MVAILDCSVILDLSRLNCFLKIFTCDQAVLLPFFFARRAGKALLFSPLPVRRILRFPPPPPPLQKKVPDRRLNKYHVIIFFVHGEKIKYIIDELPVSDTLDSKG